MKPVNNFIWMSYCLTNIVLIIGSELFNFSLTYALLGMYGYLFIRSFVKEIKDMWND